MKLFIILITLLCCMRTASAQDLIVTSKGDSINCKISKLKKDFVYFTFMHKNEVRNTMLAITDVSKHQFNYFQMSEVPANKILSKQIYQHWRIGINGGWSSRTAKLSDEIPSDFKSYYKNLMSGSNIGGDLTYFISEPLGFGFKYLTFNSSNKINSIYIDQPGANRRYGKLSDDITISFMGPSFSSRFFNATKKNTMNLSYSIGYMNYCDKNITIDPFTYTGNTLGMVLDIGYDVSISENLSLGVQLSLLAGALTQWDINDGMTSQTVKFEKDQYESLSRIDLSVGLRFNK